FLAGETRASRVSCAAVYIPADMRGAVAAPQSAPRTNRLREVPGFPPDLGWDCGKPRNWSCRSFAPVRLVKGVLIRKHRWTGRLRKSDAPGGGVSCAAIRHTGDAVPLPPGLQSSRRPLRALCRVAESLYSKSPPAGRPRASRVALIESGFKALAI